MNYSTLKSELSNDPLGRGYAGMTDAEAADSLNATDRSRLVPIPSSELLAWAGQEGRFNRIEAAQTDANQSAGIQTVAKVAMRLIERDETVLDLNKPDRVAMIDALVDAGVLTTDERTSLNTLATESISRATELGLGRVKPGHITKARA